MVIMLDNQKLINLRCLSSILEMLLLPEGKFSLTIGLVLLASLLCNFEPVFMIWTSFYGYSLALLSNFIS